MAASSSQLESCFPVAAPGALWRSHRRLRASEARSAGCPQVVVPAPCVRSPVASPQAPTLACLRICRRGGMSSPAHAHIDGGVALVADAGRCVPLALPVLFWVPVDDRVPIRARRSHCGGAGGLVALALAEPVAPAR